MVGKVVNFNPRSREGSDDCCRLFGYLRKNFNPRSREGSDTLGGYIVPLGRISIRAPARGATLVMMDL